MENPRTEIARDTNDSAMIDDLEPGTGQASSAGGNLQRDVASQDELAQVSEPGAGTRVKKSDTIEHGTEVRPDRARAPER
jgi:hypothetical protein